ncbi:MAG: hypothetical protein IT379_26270 [Deltaproteobacteria bacterium]|nr:hypothetical protein [Deltaproteobacteria bacterium]
MLWLLPIVVSLAPGSAAAQPAPSRCADALPLTELERELDPEAAEPSPPDGGTAPPSRWSHLHRFLRGVRAFRAEERACLAHDWGEQAECAGAQSHRRIPAREGRCEMLVLRVWSWPTGSGEATGDEGPGYVVATPAAGNRLRFEWVPRRAAANDRRIMSDPRLPDLDADGWSEWLHMDSHGVQPLCAAAREGRGHQREGSSCDACGLSWGVTVQLVMSASGRRLGPLPMEGRLPPRDPAMQEHWRQLLVALPRAAGGAPDGCPGEQPEVTLWDRDHLPGGWRRPTSCPTNAA